MGVVYKGLYNLDDSRTKTMYLRASLEDFLERYLMSVTDLASAEFEI